MKYILFIYLMFLFAHLAPAQFLSTEEIEFIDNSVIHIQDDIADVDEKWASLLNEIKDKRIVLLGEPNHGSKEIFTSRTDLIKALHEKLGYSVILFEAGIGEMAVMELEKEKRDPSQLLYGFFNGWRTREHEELMSYIKENEISIAGFDVQRTGGAFKYLLSDEMKRQNIIIEHNEELEEKFGVEKKRLTNRKVPLESFQSDVEVLIKNYVELNESLTTSNDKAENKRTLLVKRALANRICYLDYMLQFRIDNDWNKRWAARDKAMADNLKWLIDNFYPDEKIIVVAHNFHIAKFNENEEVMGEFLKEHYATEMYALGVFAGEGSYFGNYGTVEKIEPADSASLDIKHVINQLDGSVHVLPIPQKQSATSHWLFNPITINDTFIDLSSSNQLILAKCFDGLLLIDKISPPEK